MTKRWQFIVVLTPLLGVEVAAYEKLTAWLEWGSPLWLSCVTGLAFISLLLSGIVAMSLDIPPKMRRYIFLGGLCLYIVQAMANILIVYAHLRSHLPTSVVTSFFNVAPDVALKVTAILQGGALSVVSISSWSVLAMLLNTHLQEKATQKTAFKQRADARVTSILDKYKEVSQ